MLAPEEEIEPRVAGGGSLGEIWETWSKKFEDGQLNSSDFRSYWAVHVPQLLALNPQLSCLSPRFDEQAINYTLLQSLEKFITGSPDPAHAIKLLKQKESPPTFCGKVFKSGEPTYSCRDCGVDPTCVMCAGCFKASEHGQHKYKMNISRGGGYCDCGDREAWKQAPTCEIHDKESVADEDVVPQDMQARLRLVAETILIYAYQLLTWSKDTELPTDLQVGKKKSLFVMMLFNDESHTYEQVITSLSRAIDFPEREAVEYVATVDREGRSMIKIDGFTECYQVKTAIERTTGRNGSNALKATVMTVPLVTHQMFAARALQWIDNFCKQLRAFARIVGNVLITVPTTPIDVYPVVRCVMRHDTDLWKSARQLWHQLIINAVLMDSESKLTFAKLFARDYPDLMKAFIIDDHEHTMSVMSLSVQIFSVVSVAHTLIAEDNVLSALMRTFLSECENHKNSTTQKLAFDRNHTSTTFKRSQFVLGDLRYLLYVKPTEPWSPELRKGFFAGLELVLQLLSEMQCMDSVVRQVGQHVEFEAEWETGINIQLKLSPVLSILLEWCETDKDSLIRSLRRTLDFLVRADKSCSETNYVERSLGGSYDKEVKCIDYDVSTQPMSVHLPLSRFLSGLLLSTQKFGLDYVSYHIEIANKPSLVQIMEQPLRLQVMVAQFRAGMWRRNGYSLLNQVFFYANFRLRAETYDRDISLLQYCAAQMNPNEFLIHVLNKFDLLAWFKTADAYRPPSDVSPDMSGPLAEDFLSLILYLVAERNLPGVGEVTETDRVKKEIIQLLCMEPLPHSVLVKQLPARYDDSAMEIILEEVLRDIAVFKRVSNAIGKYELKPEYYQYFNPFFYHYSREEQSKAEEVQLKRRKAAGLPPFCPPAKLPNFSPAFKPILNILDCDVFQHVLNIILTRCRNGSSLHSDAQLERALHLVGIGLDEVQRGCLSPKFLERMSGMKESFEMASRKLEASASLMALANHIVMKMSVPASGDSGDATMTQAGPEDSTGRNKRGRNAELAAARRAKIMAAMSAQQNHFLQEHGHMFEEAADGAQDEEEDKPKFICILCREEEVVSLQAKKSLVVSAFVQKSAVLQKSARDNPGDSSPLARGLPPSDLRGGAHVSTCGHVMHSYCWQAFYELVQTKERRRPVRYGRHVSFDVAQGEFLCPLCECLSNTVIPLVPTQRDETFQVVPEKNLSEWLDGVRTIADSAVPIGTEDANEMCRGKLWKPADGIAPDHRQMLPLKAEMMLHRFVQTTSHVVLGNEDDPFLAIAWTLAYTIQATEWCIRSEDKALLADISSRKLYCLENMVKATQVVSLMGIVKGYNVASDCLQALRCILLPQTEVDSCILEIDPFGLLCLLHFSLHRISDYDTFSLSKNLLSLVTALHLVQIIISLYLQMDKQGETPEAEPSSQTPLLDVARVNEFAGEVLLAAGLSANSRFPPASRVMDALVPFLRATAILQYFAAPKECRGWMRNNQLNDASSLCSFIGLSVEHLESILRCRPLRELALSWARQPKVLHLATSHWKPIYPLKVNSLITLPSEYSELINYVSLLTCPSSDGAVNILGDEVRTPTMCLVCSAVLCSQSYCCQATWGSQRVGACVAHAAKCSAGVGVFLRIKDCRVMLLVGDSKGSYLTPPYVDEYGETDIGLARGNPLSLCSSAYMQLNQLWLTHGVPEQVAHALEASANLSSANWSRM